MSFVRERNKMKRMWKKMKRDFCHDEQNQHLQMCSRISDIRTPLTILARTASVSYFLLWQTHKKSPYQHFTASNPVTSTLFILSCLDLWTRWKCDIWRTTWADCITTDGHKNQQQKGRLNFVSVNTNKKLIFQRRQRAMCIAQPALECLDAIVLRGQK